MLLDLLRFRLLLNLVPTKPMALRLRQLLLLVLHLDLLFLKVLRHDPN